MKLAAIASSLILLLAAPMFAHHGKDFLLVESYELPHPKALYAVSAEELTFGRGAATLRDEGFMKGVEVLSFPPSGVARAYPLGSPSVRDLHSLLPAADERREFVGVRSRDRNHPR